MNGEPGNFSRSVALAALAGAMLLQVCPNEGGAQETPSADTAADAAEAGAEAAADHEGDL